jgi:integrase
MMEKSLTNKNDLVRAEDLSQLGEITTKRTEEENQFNGGAVNITIEQAIAAYLSERVSNPGSARVKATDLRQFREFLRLNQIETLGHLGQFSRVRLNKFCCAFLDSRLQQESVITVQRKKSVVKQLFKYLNAHFSILIPSVPDMDADRFRANRSKGITEGLTLEEWYRLKDRLKDSRNKELLPLVCFSLLAGGRRFSECTALTWQDLDFENGKIHVKPLKKKSEDIEHLPLVLQLKDILMALLKGQGEPEGTKRVFKTSQQSADKSLKLYAKQAGIKKTVSFHSLRTSFITWGLERGDSMSELLNATLHSSARMLRYYDRTDTLKKSSILNTQI